MRSSRATLYAALAALVLCMGFGPAAATLVDDFESGLPTGIDSNGIPIGFFIFETNGTVTIATTSTPPASVPGASAGNTVLRMDVETTNFAGFVHVFQDTAVSSLAPRDWSSFGAMTFWLYGNNTGNEMYIDVLDNRDPGPFGNSYPFEIWTSNFNDDFSGWRQLSFAFADLTRKEIGNGAPNDGLGLTAVHGWALGTLATGGTRTYYVDDVQVSGVPEPSTLALLGGGVLMMMLAVRRRRHLQH